jgi:hypothetical protein
MMKYFYLILTVLLQFLCLRVIKLLDNPTILLAIVGLSLLIGILVKLNNKENKPLRDLGWGLFYGSLASLALLVVFMIWLSFNFPK